MTRAGCGCLSDSFIKGAGINHFCCMQHCKDPVECAKRIRVLSKNHVRDVHISRDIYTWKIVRVNHVKAGRRSNKKAGRIVKDLKVTAERSAIAS